MRFLNFEKKLVMNIASAHWNCSTSGPSNLNLHLEESIQLCYGHQRLGAEVTFSLSGFLPYEHLTA